jgi:hypothetical protein
MKKVDHYAVIDIQEAPNDDEIFRYTGEGWVWIYCACGHRFKINLHTPKISIGVSLHEKRLHKKNQS